MMSSLTNRFFNNDLESAYLNINRHSNFHFLQNITSSFFVIMLLFVSVSLNKKDMQTQHDILRSWVPHDSQMTVYGGISFLTYLSLCWFGPQHLDVITLLLIAVSVVYLSITVRDNSFSDYFCANALSNNPFVSAADFPALCRSIYRVKIDVSNLYITMFSIPVVVILVRKLSFTLPLFTIIFGLFVAGILQQDSEEEIAAFGGGIGRYLGRWKFWASIVMVMVLTFVSARATDRRDRCSFLKQTLAIYNLEKHNLATER